MKIDESYFYKNNIQANTIEDVLNDDEKVLWRGNPNKKSYILSAVVKMLPIALLWLAVDSFFIVTISTQMKSGNMPLSMLGFIIPFFLIHLTPVWIWIKNIVKSATEIKNVEYAITDRRIILRSGVIGIDFKFVNFTEIDSINVKVGIVERMFRVGDIYVNSSVNSAVLQDIDNPYDIGRKLQKVVSDIKADIQYPNSLRPQNNDGYNTEYTDDPFKND